MNMVVRSFLTLTVLTVLFAMPTASASTPITGTATSCTSFYACAYTITGGGWATTSGLVTFLLPGEAKSSTSQTYLVQNLGHTGNTYHISGSFTAIDANTEKVVTGTTNDYIIQTSYCNQHGCSYHYSLSSGTITFTLTNKDATSTSVLCNPSTFNAGGATKCTVTVTDLANSKSFPTGKITFSSSALGTFTSTSCTLSTGKCSVTFRPADESIGGIVISAPYPGDSTHWTSSASTTIDVLGS